MRFHACLNYTSTMNKSHCLKALSKQHQNRNSSFEGWSCVFIDNWLKPRESGGITGYRRSSKSSSFNQHWRVFFSFLMQHIRPADQFLGENSVPHICPELRLGSVNTVGEWKYRHVLHHQVQPSESGIFIKMIQLLLMVLQANWKLSVGQIRPMSQSCGTLN